MPLLARILAAGAFLVKEKKKNTFWLKKLERLKIYCYNFADNLN